MRPCRLASAGDADMGLSQLPKLTGLYLGGTARGDLVSASRTQGEGWRVGMTTYRTPDVAAVLARSFNSGAAPPGQLQQPAAGEDEQRSSFLVAVKIQPGPSLAQTSQLASLGRALAAFDTVSVWLHCDVKACPATAHALLQPVAARLNDVGAMGSSSAACGVLEALQRLVLPRLKVLRLSMARDACDPDAVAAVVGLDAPCLATIMLKPAIAGSRTDAAAAVTALAMGRPRPVGPDGQPAGLQVAVSKAVLSDEELGSVRRVVSAAGRAGWVTVARLAS
jgi:hypothetical protein